MRLDLFDGEETTRVIGAIVIRAVPRGDVLVDIGPADGAPLVRLRLNHDEAARLGKGILLSESSGEETVIIVDG